MLALSMKQNRYSNATVGTIMRSIFNLSLRSATGSKWTSACPYLRHRQYMSFSRDVPRTYWSVAAFPRAAASCAPACSCSFSSTSCLPLEEVAMTTPSIVVVSQMIQRTL